MVIQQSLIKEKGLLHLNGITSSQILALLESKHFKDVFVPECKNGETWGARDLLKIDAWVLRRTYSPLTIIGYEIKTSRQDFEQDQKWTSYLDLCHEFYFACPAGLIRATDLPSRVGIIWASKDKLHTKHKAQRVEPDWNKLNGLLIYILMSRCKIVANMLEINIEPPKDRLTSIKEWTARANERKELADFVKGHVHDIFTETQRKHFELKNREDTIKRFEERLAILGIKWDSQNDTWQDTMRIENEIDLLKKRIDDRTLGNMKALARELTDVANIITQYHSK